MTNPRTLALVVLCALDMGACRGEKSATVKDEAVVSFEQVTPQQWTRLSEQRIFFGHQSVGGNLIDGVRDVLAENGRIPLQVVEMQDPANASGTGLFHARVGKNGDPATKLAAFREIAPRAVGDSGIALLKYCYVDVTSNTDPEALFAAYREGVDALRMKHPDLRIVHLTLPLLTDIGTIRYVAARIRGRQTGREVNLVRNRYNELLRQTYRGKEPIFDLARLESIGPDGSIAAVRFAGERVPVLSRAWTNDGGHLNEAGRKRMAKAFLATLASLYEG